MISALARAAVVPAEALADRRAAYLAAALRAAAFADRELFNLPGGLPRRSWRRGSGSGPGFAEDCAFVIQAWLDLYEATFDKGWLERAERLQRVMDGRFWDSALSMVSGWHGCFWSNNFKLQLHCSHFWFSSLDLLHGY